MNKKLIYIGFFIVFIFHFHSVNAKSINGRKDSGLYISLNGGSCMPLGYFKSSTYTGEGGYAMNGYGGSISIERPLKPGWLGLIFEGGYYENPFNLSTYKYFVNPQLSPYSYTYYSATPYKEAPILGGLSLKKSVNAFVVELKCTVGPDFIQLPYVDAIETNITTEPIIMAPRAAELMNPSQSETILVYNLTITIRYAFMKHLYICGNASYLNSFSNTFGKNSEYAEDTPLSQLHLEIGLAYHF